jgi:hypothetical protein
MRIRPHHLLCMLTYAGNGYSPAFTANFDGIAARAAQGEEILIVSGPDDICAPLLGEEGLHCREESIVERDKQAAAALTTVLGYPISPGGRIELGIQILMRLRRAFAAGEIRQACAGCQWATMCTSIAANGYRETKIGLAGKS